MNKIRTDDSEAHLIGIYEIGKVLGASFDLDRALHDVLNILSSYLAMRHGVIVLTDHDDQLVMAAVTGMSLAEAKSGGIRYPVEAIRPVVDRGMPMVVPSAVGDPDLADYIADFLEPDDDSLAFLCVPIKTNDKPFGSLSVLRGRESGALRGFQHDIRFLTMVGTLIGQTVSLYRKVLADRERLMEDNVRLQKQVIKIAPSAAPHGMDDIIGASDAINNVLGQIQQAAPTKATVLLRGESGTGKEMMAQALHQMSKRAQKPFIKVNCAALSESVLESELFGHEKGAFTGAIAERKGRFELANGGTLFLDEIGEISQAFQSKLLRVLQEGEFERVGGVKTIKVDVRLVAATNRDLEAAVTKGEFRADLYFRLNVVPIFLPPLRDRKADIPALADHFLKQFNQENGRTVGITAKALQTLQRCNFPGNVRELENCVYRSATMASDGVIDEIDLSCKRDTCLSSTLWGGKPGQSNLAAAMQPHEAGHHHHHPAPSAAAPAPAPAAQPAPVSAGDGDEAELDADDERGRLIQAMERCGWVQAKAARLLGLTPRQIGYALKKHNIEIRQL
ncbi:nif-specific transcriptional activator NifA [Magnetospirillum moscoviense]|uniref:Nif-specific regulatory protein n=1 Tax=Magnetospirillum moscoviense TaxID=1437059 RepID=A0A178MEU1_9PROT|nr:nif-specific transcriptional activator NifA [Magnetospirillum moscoviense]OAN46404.1 nif-specific transcriptional activator NifA [Magnetospirillum moscoviense]